MTKKQASTLIALGVAILLAQVLCTGLLLRGQERTRKEAEACQDSAMESVDMLKRAAGIRAIGP